jgi:SET domain-containing protein
MNSYKRESAPAREIVKMKHRYYFLVSWFAGFFVASSYVLLYAQQAPQTIKIVKVNKEYDKRTVIKPSTIPNAGNGLFAGVKIKKGEVIGELGGKLVTLEDYPQANHYIASIPECARKETEPYKYIDAKDYGANVSRINFAPSNINGVETNFQNATIKQICQHPYFVFLALADIEPGTEIWSSYGPDYEYEPFMTAPEVQSFFCGLLKIDCSETFTYSH